MPVVSLIVRACTMRRGALVTTGHAQINSERARIYDVQVFGRNGYNGYKLYDGVAAGLAVSSLAAVAALAAGAALAAVAGLAAVGPLVFNLHLQGLTSTTLAVSAFYNHAERKQQGQQKTIHLKKTAQNNSYTSDGKISMVSYHLT